MIKADSSLLDNEQRQVRRRQREEVRAFKTLQLPSWAWTKQASKKQDETRRSCVGGNWLVLAGTGYFGFHFQKQPNRDETMTSVTNAMLLETNWSILSNNTPRSAKKRKNKNAAGSHLLCGSSAGWNKHSDTSIWNTVFFYEVPTKSDRCFCSDLKNLFRAKLKSHRVFPNLFRLISPIIHFIVWVQRTFRRFRFIWANHQRTSAFNLQRALHSAGSM